MNVAIFLIAWLVCGTIAALALYRFTQSEWPKIAKITQKDTIALALVWVICGPISLMIELTHGGFKHGINPFRKP